MKMELKPELQVQMELDAFMALFVGEDGGNPVMYNFPKES